MLRSAPGAAILIGLSLLLAAGAAEAQVGPGLGQRDCQTVRTCRYTGGGSFRGCISAYTCRTCRPVRAPCHGGVRGRVCHDLRCTWGG